MKILQNTPGQNQARSIHVSPKGSLMSMPDPEFSTGLIIRAQSGFFFVLPAGQAVPVTCQLRGRLKQGRRG
jgi:hypothetical protein